MNKIFRLIWNATRNLWVVVSEIASSHSTSASATVTGTISIMLLLPGIALALPQGAQVVSGQATISQNGNSMDIQQASHKAILNWQSFNIGTQEAVNFHQPGVSSIALNRVLGQDPSAIYGRLNANGQVFLVNPNGIFFAPGSQVNTGGIVASTLNISDQDFLNGNYSFSGQSNAGILNQGNISSSNGGHVVFISRDIVNEGTINTTLGSTAMGAGQKVSLTLADNQLVSFKVDEAALDAQIKNGGLIQADGGTVILSAEAKDALLQTVVNNSGEIRAQSLENRNGTIYLLGGNSGTTQVAGTLDASAPVSGSGGFIETSGAHIKIANGTKITTEAANGENGTWLIDPMDFTIAASGGDITGAELEYYLDSTNVKIETRPNLVCDPNGCRGPVPPESNNANGDIHVNDTISWSKNTLTLSAYRDININTAMYGTGTARLTLEYGQGSSNGKIGDRDATYNVKAPINLASTASFFTKLGSSGTQKIYTVITSLGTNSDGSSANNKTLQGLSHTSMLGGNYVLGSNIDASATANWSFTPIGTFGSPFTGTFDGLGHTVSNLNISSTGSATRIGLFGRTYNGASLRNIGIQGGNISGSATSYAGGLVGEANMTSISNSYSTANISGGYAGGLVGSLSLYSTLDNSYATGAVTGSSSSDTAAGGLVGEIANQAEIKNSYSTGTVNGTTVGGLVGKSLSNSKVTYSYWNTQTSGRSSSAGGIGRTTAQMQDPFFFIDNGWNFDAAWTKSASNENNGHMMLQWQPGNLYDGFLRVDGWLQREYGAENPELDTVITKAGKTAVTWGSAITQTTDTGLYSWDSPSVLSVTGGNIYQVQSYGDIQIVPTDLVIKAKTNFTKTYGETYSFHKDEFTFTGLKNGETFTPELIYSDGAPDGARVNNGNPYYVIVIAPAYEGTFKAGNYNIISEGTLTVTPRTLKLAASANSKVYDGNTSATINSQIHIDVLGAISGKDVQLTNDSSGYFANKNVGNNIAVTTYVSLTGADADNYTLLQPTGLSANITPRPLSLSAEKSYDGTTSLTGYVSLGNLVSGESLNYSGAVASNAHVATASKYISAITLQNGSGGGLAANYQLPVLNAANAPVVINPATLTPTLTNIGVSKSYDGSTEAPSGFTPSYSFSGLVAGDTDAVLTYANADYDSKNVTEASTITLSGLGISSIAGTNASQATDYVLSNTNSALSANITPRSLSLSAEKVYDGTTELTGYVGLGNLVSGESLNYSGAVASNAHVATASKYISAITLQNGSGGLASNYQLPVLNATNAPVIINPATLTPTITNSGVSKNYDGSTKAPSGFTPSYNFSGLVAGDTNAVLTYANAEYDSKNVTEASKITLSGLGISSIVGSNGSQTTDYVLDSTSKNVSASITHAAASEGTTDSSSIATVMQDSYPAPSGGSSLIIKPLKRQELLLGPNKSDGVQLMVPVSTAAQHDIDDAEREEDAELNNDLFHTIDISPLLPISMN